MGVVQVQLNSRVPSEDRDDEVRVGKEMSRDSESTREQYPNRGQDSLGESL